MAVKKASAKAAGKPSAKKKVVAKTAAVSKKTAVKKKAATAKKKVATTVNKKANVKTVAASVSGGQVKTVIASDAHENLVREAAYLISQHRCMGASGPDTDWIQAEAVINMFFDVAS